MGWLDKNGIEHETEFDDMPEHDIVSTAEDIVNTDLEPGGYTITFEPAPELESEITSERRRVLPDDEMSFSEVLGQKFGIFLERKETYGNHLENAKRFPLEHYCGVYLKACRIIRMIESAVDIQQLKDIDPDTLFDMSNYPDLILSSMDADDRA